MIMSDQTIDNTLLFERRSFSELVNFDNSKVTGSLIFRHCVFEKGFSAQRADIIGSLILYDCQVPDCVGDRANVDLRLIKIGNNLVLDGSQIGNPSEPEKLGILNVAGATITGNFSFHFDLRTDEEKRASLLNKWNVIDAFEGQHFPSEYNGDVQQDYYTWISDSDPDSVQFESPKRLETLVVDKIEGDGLSCGGTVDFGGIYAGQIYLGKASVGKSINLGWKPRHRKFERTSTFLVSTITSGIDFRGAKAGRNISLRGVHCMADMVLSHASAEQEFKLKAARLAWSENSLRHRLVVRTVVNGSVVADSTNCGTNFDVRGILIGPPMVEGPFVEPRDEHSEVRLRHKYDLILHGGVFGRLDLSYYNANPSGEAKNRPDVATDPSVHRQIEPKEWQVTLVRAVLCNNIQVRSEISLVCSKISQGVQGRAIRCGGTFNVQTYWQVPHIKLRTHIGVGTLHHHAGTSASIWVTEADIGGHLTLSGSKFESVVLLHRADIRGSIYCKGVHAISRLSCGIGNGTTQDGTLGCLSMVGATIKGSIYGEGLQAMGPVDFRKISVQSIDFKSTKFKSKTGLLWLSSAKLSKDLLLGGLTVVGPIVAELIQVGGDITTAGAKLQVGDSPDTFEPLYNDVVDSGEKYSIWLKHARVAGDVRLIDATVSSMVVFDNANIGGCISIVGENSRIGVGTQYEVKNYSLLGRNFVVGGLTEVKAAKLDGCINFRGAQLKGGFQLGRDAQIGSSAGGEQLPAGFRVYSVWLQGIQSSGQIRLDKCKLLSGLCLTEATFSGQLLIRKSELGLGVTRSKEFFSLDLRSARTTSPIRFEEGTSFVGPVQLSMARLERLVARSVTFLDGLDGKYTTVAGGIEFTGCRVFGPLSFQNATITGHIDLDTSRGKVVRGIGFELQGWLVNTFGEFKWETLEYLRSRLAIGKLIPSSVLDLYEEWKSDPRKGIQMALSLDLASCRLSGSLLIRGTQFFKGINIRGCKIGDAILGDASQLDRIPDQVNAFNYVPRDRPRTGEEVPTGWFSQPFGTYIGSSSYLNDNFSLRILSAEIGGEIDLKEVRCTSGIGIAATTIGASLCLRKATVGVGSWNSLVDFDLETVTSEAVTEVELPVEHSTAREVSEKGVKTVHCIVKKKKTCTETMSPNECVIYADGIRCGLDMILADVTITDAIARAAIRIEGGRVGRNCHITIKPGPGTDLDHYRPIVQAQNLTVGSKMTLNSNLFRHRGATLAHLKTTELIMILDYDDVLRIDELAKRDNLSVKHLLMAIPWYRDYLKLDRPHAIADHLTFDYYEAHFEPDAIAKWAQSKDREPALRKSIRWLRDQLFAALPWISLIFFCVTSILPWVGGSRLPAEHVVLASVAGGILSFYWVAFVQRRQIGPFILSKLEQEEATSGSNLKEKIESRERDKTTSPELPVNMRDQKTLRLVESKWIEFAGLSILLTRAKFHSQLFKNVCDYLQTIGARLYSDQVYRLFREEQIRARSEYSNFLDKFIARNFRFGTFTNLAFVFLVVAILHTAAIYAYQFGSGGFTSLKYAVSNILSTGLPTPTDAVNAVPVAVYDPRTYLPTSMWPKDIDSFVLSWGSYLVVAKYFVALQLFYITLGTTGLFRRFKID